MEKRTELVDVESVVAGFETLYNSSNLCLVTFLLHEFNDS